MKKTVCLLFVLTVAAAAEMSLPEGIPVRVRLSNDLPRATAVTLGQPVELSVIEEVRFQGNLAIAVGARATGTCTAGDKNHKLVTEFSIDRVQTVDGSWINLRNAARKDTTAALVRTDQASGRDADPDLVLPRGATFGLFVDEKKTVAMIPTEQPKQDPSTLQWLASQIDLDSSWSQNFFKVGCCFLVMLAFLHQRRMNRQV